MHKCKLDRERVETAIVLATRTPNPGNETAGVTFYVEQLRNQVLKQFLCLGIPHRDPNIANLVSGSLWEVANKQGWRGLNDPDLILSGLKSYFELRHPDIAARIDAVGDEVAG